MTSLNPVLPIGLQIMEPLLIHLGLDEAGARARAIELLGLVGIPDADRRLDQYPHQFSGGMRQRVMIAIALACNPKLIIADEPTAGLDVSVQGEILNLLAHLQREFGLTCIVITHNLAVVRHVSDAVAIMYMGRFVELGPTADIFARPAHPYTAALIEAQTYPDPARRRPRPALPGEAASLLNRPPGCEFHPRCPKAQLRCSQDRPQISRHGARVVRCHFPLIAANS
jgi:peptide/nickel transport system ATP-binding protein